MRASHSLKILLGLAVAAGPVAATNPTHYGPPSNVDGVCQSDESDRYFNQCGSDGQTCYLCSASCSDASDCPTDKPDGTTASPICSSDGQCMLSCSSDDQCEPGAWCWIPSGDTTGYCTYTLEKDCYYIESVEGSWVSISSSSSSQTVSYAVGMTTVATDIEASSWGTALATAIEDGFTVEVPSGSYSVTGSTASSLSTTYSSVVSTTPATTSSSSFGSGVLWQWTFDFTLGCGTATATGQDLVLTPNVINAPCCLPGMFVDIEDPFSQCVDGTPTMCDRSDIAATTSGPSGSSVDESAGAVAAGVVSAIVIVGALIAIPLIIKSRAKAKMQTPVVQASWATTTVAVTTDLPQAEIVGGSDYRLSN